MSVSSNPYIEKYFRIFVKDFSIDINFSNQRSVNDIYEKFVNYLLAYIEYYKSEGVDEIDSNFSWMDFIEESQFGINSAMAIDGCFFVFNTRNAPMSLGALIDEESENKESELKKGLKKIYVNLVQTKTGRLSSQILNDLASCLTSGNEHASWQDFHKAKAIIQDLVVNSEDHIDIEFNFYYVAQFEDNSLNNDGFKTRESNLRVAMNEFFWKPAKVSIDFLKDTDVVAYAKSVFSPSVNVPNLKVSSDDIFSRSITFRELYEKVLVDSATGLRREIYDANIRDFDKESNAVKSMKKTLKDETMRSKFHLLNNGITMVVKGKDPKPDNFLGLKDISIINGCQTSHVIIDKCRENIHLYGDCRVMLRIIDNQDSDLIRSITYATNNQTPVVSASLLSSKEPMKKLCEFFKLKKDGELLLELRRNQFDDALKVKNEETLNTQEDFISISELAKSYKAIWLAEPHKAVQFERENIEDLEKAFIDIYFNEKSYFCAYLSNFIQNRDNYSSFKVARYQILTIMSMLMFGKKSPKELLEVKIDSSNLMKILDKNQLNTSFTKAEKAFDEYKGSIRRVDYRHFYKSNVLDKIFKKIPK